MTTNNFSKAIQTGWIVMSILFILTIIEFSVAIFLEGKLQIIGLFISGLLPAFSNPEINKLQIIGLFISGLLKAGLILQTFMHFGQLWENISNLWWGVVLTFEEKDEK